MSGITQGYTRDEIRGFVHEYYLQPFGQRKAWLDSKSLTVWTFRQWRTMVFEGHLDRSLVPREDGGMTGKDGERSAFEKLRSREIAKHQSEIGKLEKRIAELEGTNEALGKAIGLLHELSGPEPDTAPTNDPNDS
jgi:hypothetical protein